MVDSKQKVFMDIQVTVDKHYAFILDEAMELCQEGDESMEGLKVVKTPTGDFTVTGDGDRVDDYIDGIVCGDSVSYHTIMATMVDVP